MHGGQLARINRVKRPQDAQLPVRIGSRIAKDRDLYVHKVGRSLNEDSPGSSKFLQNAPLAQNSCQPASTGVKQKCIARGFTRAERISDFRADRHGFDEVHRMERQAR